MSEHLKALTDNPELADGFTAEEVAEARAELNDFKDAVKAGEQEAGSEAIAEAKAIAERLTERETALQVEAEARQAEIDALEEALGGKPEEDDDDDEEADEEDSVEVPDTPAEIVEEEVVVAAAPSGNLKGLKSRVPAERKPSENTGPVLVASAAQYAGQDILTASALGEMFSRSWKGLPDTAVSTPFRLASFNTEGQHKYTVKAGDDEGNFRALAELTKDASENGNLVAAGGFCAPPQPLYTFFNIASRAGILNLPTVNAPRGSISLPTSPSLGDFLGQSGIATEWTDENDEEPTTPATKPVFIIDCPPFTTCEVSAWPTIIQAGNFQQRFFPESIANAVELAVIAADRTLNAARLAFMRSVATNGTETATLGGGIIGLARNLGQAAAAYRREYGMSPDAPLDAAAPHWVPDALYVDALARGSTVDYNSVRAKVDGILGQFNIRAQYVYDLDDMAANGAFPGTADFLLWAPGTVVELDGGTLDLGVVRDSTLNSLNNFQTFVEPFVGWCQPGHEVVLLDEVAICSDGTVGEAANLAC